MPNSELADLIIKLEQYATNIDVWIKDVYEQFND